MSIQFVLERIRNLIKVRKANGERKQLGGKVDVVMTEQRILGADSGMRRRCARLQ